MSAWVVKKQVRYGLFCTTCGCKYRFSSLRPTPQEAEKYREHAERYGCKECTNRATVAALPPHHAHHEHNPDWPYPGDPFAPCCAAVQCNLMGLYDCAECGQPYPCPTARAESNE